MTQALESSDEDFEAAIVITLNKVEKKCAHSKWREEISAKNGKYKKEQMEV